MAKIPQRLTSTQQQHLAKNLKNLLAIDVETSGPNPHRHQLLAVALLPCVKGGVPFQVFVRQENIEWGEIGQQYFQGYQSDWESHAVSPDEAFVLLAKYLATFPNELTLIGHNVGFDFSFLKQLLMPGDATWFPTLSHRCVDTHSLLKALVWMGRIPESACSSTGAFAYFGIKVSPKERHTALGDAKATAHLVRILAAEFELLRKAPSGK